MNAIQVLAISLLMISVSSVSHASTLVTFDPNNGSHTNVGGDGGITTGTWVESGFDVNWLFVDNGSDTDFSYATGSFNYLSDCSYGGCLGSGIFLDFSRPDGATFSLQSMAINFTASSWMAEASFTPYDEFGNLDYFKSIYAEPLVTFENLSFTATKANGQTVLVYASSFDDTLVLLEAGNFINVKNDGILNIDDELELALSEIVNLQVSIATPRYGPEQVQESIDIEIAPVFSLAPANCGIFCKVAGLGEFSFYASDGNFQNWGTAVAVDDFNFSVGKIPAPVPLPAGFPIYFVTLATFGLLFHKR